jgi:hypothetical protein
MAEDTSGYKCDIIPSGMASGMTESINSNAGTLLSNIIVSMSRESPWTKAFAIKFMRENGVPRFDTYFDCAAVQDLIRRGSLLTLGTTAATKEDLLD